MNTKQKHIINEIFNTEKTYNKTLHIIYDSFTYPMQKGIENGLLIISGKKPKEMDECLSMFFSLDKVKEASDHLINLFKEKNIKETGQGVGDCFIDFSSMINAYFVYISEYHLSIDKFHDLISKTPVFTQFIQTAEDKLQDTLEAALITPVQRPPRYRLLLQELIKTTDKDSPDYPKLAQALEIITAATSHVDESLALFEEGNMKTEIEQICPDFDIHHPVGRRVYYYGTVSKFSRKRIHQRFLAIFSDCLLVGAESKIGTTYKTDKVFPTGHYLIVGVSDNPPFINAIDVRQAQKSFRANCPTPDVKLLILNNFKLAMFKNRINIDELHKKGFAPVWIPDKSAPVCMRCNVEFTMFNRRHHCRFCGDCICSKCFQKKIVIPGQSEEPQGVCEKCFTKISTGHYQDPEEDQNESKPNQNESKPDQNKSKPDQNPPN